MPEQLPQRHALIIMLEMQERTNRKVADDWVAKQFEWYRAIWIECAELMDHYGYKWWKQQHADTDQVQLEVVDIWHFGMSALFDGDKMPATIADEILADLAGPARESGVLEATEALAAHSLQSKGFSARLFRDLMFAAGLDFDSLYRQYIGKNVLNFFRQDFGYKDGSYIKLWGGREDNEHLMEVLAEMDSEAEGFADDLYQALSDRYQRLAMAVES